MKQTTKTVEEIFQNEDECPLPLDVIPNNMGINLANVDAISWQRQDDGQLTSVTIYFIPSTKKVRSKKPVVKKKKKK